MGDFREDRIREAMEAHKELLAQFERSAAPVIRAAADAIVQAFKNGGTLYLCGNGGSAADAQHIAGEMVGRFRTERRALPAVALSTDTSVLTCVGNDYSYCDVFARQVEAHVRPGDILWGLSTSGASPNVVKAVEVAKRKGARIIAFTGKKDSKLAALADICLCADAEATARSQEIHQLAYHIICDLVEQCFCE
jgi:D-sedoheptulose 7-phosphate isomerase